MFRHAKHARTLTLAAAVLAGNAICATQDDELLVDPTVPLSVAFGNTAAEGSEDDSGSIFDIFSNTFASYELSSVLIRAEDRIAVINEQRVRVGDKVGSATVRSIEADHVTLSVDGEIETLELYGNSIKTLVKGDE